MSSNIIEAPAPLAESMQMTTQRLLRAYLLEIKYEFIKTLRNPGFGIPFILLPVVLFLVFSSMRGEGESDSLEASMHLFSGMAIFGIMGPALYGFGAYLAVERQFRHLEFKRALPMPAGAHLIAKMVSALIYAAIVIVSIISVAVLTGKVALTLPQALLIAVCLLLGVLPFCAIGFFIGSRASASAASGLTTLVFLPQIYLSALFFPLPKAVEALVLIMPPFYLKQLVVDAGGGTPYYVGGPIVHIVLLLIITVGFTVLAAKRMTRHG